MLLDYVKQKEEGKGLENFGGRGGGGTWMYEVGETEETSSAKGLALIVNENFTDYLETI